jgi:hypothetical protein
MEKGQIPNMSKTRHEMLGKIDALIVDHRHPKLPPGSSHTICQKRVFPTVYRQPVLYRLEEGKEFLAIARSAGTPVSSYSDNGTFGRELDSGSRCNRWARSATCSWRTCRPEIALGRRILLWAYIWYSR